jgi:nucleoid DNA-binding protein
MTFYEWCKTIAREHKDNVPTEFVYELMVTAVRVAIEELLANPERADLDINGIGRFYLNYRKCHNNFAKTEEQRYTYNWEIKFRPSIRLKEVLNGKADPHYMLIGTKTALYPDIYFGEDNKLRYISGNKNTKTGYYERSFTVKTNDSFRKAEQRAMREALKNYLPPKDEQ